ncbi:MAG: hypothetical protein ACI8S6_004662, partial [Myxococcota bacterium]
SDGWVKLEVSAVVPKGATKVQAAIEFYECFGIEEGVCGYAYAGGVYFDDVVFGKVEK